MLSLTWTGLKAETTMPPSKPIPAVRMELGSYSSATSHAISFFHLLLMCHTLWSYGSTNCFGFQSVAEQCTIAGHRSTLRCLLARLTDASFLALQPESLHRPRFSLEISSWLPDGHLHRQICPANHTATTVASGVRILSTQ